MRGVLAKALIVAGLIVPLCGYAQSRGGGHAAFSGSRGFRGYAAAPQYRMSPRQVRTTSSTYRRLWAPTATGSSLVNPGQASCLFNTPYSNSLYCRQFNYGRSGLGYEPIYPYWMPSGGYDTGETAAPPPATEPPEDNQLADEVGNLAAQVQMMRQGQAETDYRAYTPPVPPEAKPPVTVLIYRDGHAVEVQNYAIVGDTLWVISDQTTRRVPLSELNLAATERANESRGVEFEPPDQH